MDTWWEPCTPTSPAATFSIFCAHLRRGEPRAEFASTWGRNRIRQIQAGIDVPTIGDVDHMFFGHTPVPEPFTHRNCTWIDTGMLYGTGTVLDADRFLDDLPLRH